MQVEDISIEAPRGFQSGLKSAAERVETRLGELLSSDSGDARALEDAMRFGALDGGKRIRPFLLIESAGLFGMTADQALDAACALECVHCYSLIHDDLPAMDDDALRRGRPTVHVAFDDATAILAGDALLTLAFEILAGSRTHARAEVRNELILGLAQAAGHRGMAGGQALDLAAEGAQLAADDIRRIQSLKTGALIGFACEAGAVLGGASRSDRAALKDYGTALGEAFQLADDLLDFEGDAALVGKATGKDADAGKATLVGLLGADAARTHLHALEDSAIAALAGFGERAAMLRQAAHFVTRRAH